MDQGRRLERVPGVFPSHPGCGQLAELLIDQRQQLLGRLAIAGFDLGEDPRDVAHNTTPALGAKIS
jgi:hypothetical protein